jgi:tetratricopeptide (TPR) repeat protein
MNVVGTFYATLRIILCLTLGIMLTAAIPVFAVNETIIAARKLMDDGITLQNKQTLIKARGQFEQVYIVKNDVQALYYLTYSECWLCLFGVARNGDPSLVDVYLDKAIEHAENLVARMPYQAEPKVILATLYGIRLKSNALNLIIVGPRIESLIDEALALEPNNPRVLYVQGNALFYKPAIFGGGVRKALDVWKRAQVLYEKELQQPAFQSSMKPNWGYLETLAALGQCYEAVSEWENARTTYKRGLALKPNYKWIQYELLPNLEQKYPERLSEK